MKRQLQSIVHFHLGLEERYSIPGPKNHVLPTQSVLYPPQLYGNSMWRTDLKAGLLSPSLAKDKKRHLCTARRVECLNKVRVFIREEEKENPI